MKPTIPRRILLMLCLLLLLFTAGCGSGDSSSLPTKKPSSSKPAASSAPAASSEPVSSSVPETFPVPSGSETVPQDPAELFEQNMNEIFAEIPEQPSAGDSAGASLDAEILKKTEWKIVSQNDNTLEIAVTSPDMQTMLQGKALDLLAQPDGVAQILALLQGNDLPMKEVTISVTLDENGNPTDPAALTDALYGGLLSVLEEVYASMEAEK